MAPLPTVAGIDIGGDRKGCHLVVLRGDEIVCSTNSRAPEDLLQRCIELEATAIGIDSPLQGRTRAYGDAESGYILWFAWLNLVLLAAMLSRARR